ncbi:hypothetical protein GGS23DRAFT_509310 [Durotheca rogersii]|uniref:uncharacterized protein n=1 Tax=Durotheca rogersii TaxID=419775 RepID=UPI00221FF1A6|nr:uncharacterized protein GGS23DRAFT_509310 [Durotheca rogersii]KAI5863657.1 hypothetical protein GGS23DRAFT_509310 [Durotheca rogersii]
MNPKQRQAQLDMITKNGLDRMRKHLLTYTVAGNEFVVRDQMAQVTTFVLKIKSVVDEAVKASVEASIVWASVCLVLPLLTNPNAAEQANRDGLIYVTSRMRFYIALEPLLLPRDQSRSSTIPKGLRVEFEIHVRDLYQKILEFQLQSVLRFYERRLNRLGKDLVRYEDWEGMLSEVHRLENVVDGDFHKINDAALRAMVEDLKDDARQSLESTQGLLSLATKQLRVTEEHRDIGSAQLQEQRRTNALIAKSVNAIRLPTVSSAVYGSSADQHIPLCQSGTRASILKYINSWANDPLSKTIFWLQGPAGTGKSTISRTLAHDWKYNHRRLFASYFFKRGEKDRNGSAFVFPTIANQMTKLSPGFQTHLHLSLESLGDDKIEDRALDEQFEILFLTPLSEIDRDSPDSPAKVIVIDGLDECDNARDVQLICKQLSRFQEVVLPRIRIFLTSRPTGAITSAFNGLDTAKYTKLALNEDFVGETKEDISTFLSKQFEDIKLRLEIEDPWPMSKDLERLVSLATTPWPLFIYASTVCRFIDDEEGLKDPVERLELWLEQSDANTPQLDQIYNPILHNIFFGSHDQREKPKPLSDSEKSELRGVLGAIILIVTPLPVRCLATLLGISQTGLNRWLRQLRSVLNIPSDQSIAIPPPHKSFSDFLLGQEGTGSDSFQIDALEAHADLASRCLNRLRHKDDGLRKDMCGLQKPGILVNDIDQTVAASRFPADLVYACVHWSYHLESSVGENKNAEVSLRLDLLKDVEAFLQQHFLHWLECLSLLGRFTDGLLSIRRLLRIVQPDISMELTRFLRDAERFALNYRSIIENAPLQIYGAALVFCPTETDTRRYFWKDRHRFVKDVLGIGNTWDPCLQTFECHNQDVRAIAFSPDGKTLASASWFSPLPPGLHEHTIRLWDAESGAHIRTLGTYRGVTTIAFPNNTTLVAASPDHVVRFWDIKEGKHWGFRDSFAGDTQNTGIFDLSPHGTLLPSSFKDGTIRLLETESKCSRHKFKCFGSNFHHVTFSQDNTLLAAVSENPQSSARAIQCWNIETGEQLVFECNDNCASAIAFSPDNATLALAFEEKTIQFWDIDSGDHRQVNISFWLQHITFSPDGRKLASTFEDSVWLYHIESNNQQTFKNHTNWVNAIAFSPDGTKLASASGDSTIRMWDVEMNSRQPLEGHSRDISASAFSPGFKMLAVAFANEEIQLWDTKTGNSLRVLHNREYITAMAFSPDGATLASTCWECKVQTWIVESGSCMCILEGHTDYVQAVAFSPDGQTIASASADQTVRLWKVTTGDCQRILDGHSKDITDVVFSSGGTTIASASRDERVRIWNIETGDCLAIFEGHIGYVSAMAFSPDDAKLVAVSGRLIQLWDVNEPAHLGTGSLNQYVPHISFSNDGQHLEIDGSYSKYVLAIDALDIAPHQIPSDPTVYVNDGWISRDGKNLLRVAPGYRAIRSCRVIRTADNCQMLALMHATGQLAFLSFTFSEMTI